MWPFRHQKTPPPAPKPTTPVCANGMTIGEVLAEFNQMNTAAEMHVWMQEFGLTQRRGLAEGFPPNYNPQCDLYVAELYQFRAQAAASREAMEATLRHPGATP